MTGPAHEFSPEGPRCRCIHLLGQYRKLQALSGTSGLQYTFLVHRMTEGGVQSLNKILKGHMKTFVITWGVFVMIFLKYNSDGYDHGPAQYAHSEVLILLVGFYTMPTLFFPVCFL